MVAALPAEERSLFRIVLIQKLHKNGKGEVSRLSVREDEPCGAHKNDPFQARYALSVIYTGKGKHQKSHGDIAAYVIPRNEFSSVNFS